MPPSPPRVSFDSSRLRGIRLRHALAGLAIITIAIAVIPPLRRATAMAASRVILFVASPLAPDIKGFDRLPQTTRVLAADGSVLVELDEQKRTPVTLEDVPNHVERAVLAAEDATFYRHSGIEPTAVFRAVVRTAQGDTQGGSTITQQLAKINYTSSERTVLRKLRELLYATRLEREYSKDQLLQRYLNQVYFGDGAYGITAAARTYFGVEASELTAAQAAFLAGRIRAPEAYDPREKEKPAVERRNQVLANMADNGWLNERDLRAARREDLGLADPDQGAAATDHGKAPHFVEFVKREAKTIDALGGSKESRAEQLLTGGYAIETTLDPAAFDAAVRSVGETLGEPADPAVAIVSVEPGDGAIRNLFGGLNFERKFDVASQGRRQPGSAFKPFVYLAALRAGIDPRSTFDASSPKSFNYRGEPFEVNNYEGQGFGQMNADDGLVHSVNTVYMAFGLEVGPPNIMKAALDAKAPAKDSAITPVAALALGGLKEGVTPLEMAAAYATFAAEGVYAEPYSIARIRDASGKVIYEHQRETKPVFRPEEVGVLNATLQRVVTEGTGTGAAIGRPLAGKTGTTQNYGDAWFVGYLPQLATSVWVGYADGMRPMDNVHGRQVSGGSFPASIFSDVVAEAVKDMPVKRLRTTSPDELNLRKVSSQHMVTSSTTSSTSSSTSTSSTLPTTTTPGATTTRPTRQSTTTTTTKQRGTTTTTTTSQPATTSSSTSTTSTTVKASSNSSTSTTSTTSPPP